MIFPSWVQDFSIPEINETLKDSLTKFFGTVRQKFFDGSSWYSPPPVLIDKLFGYRKFSEKQHRRVPLRNFSALSDNKFSIENRDFPLFGINFLIPEFSGTLKRSSTNFFGTVRQKTFRQKIVILPPSSSPCIHKFLGYQKFCKTQKCSRTKFFGTVRQQIFYRKS